MTPTFILLTILGNGIITQTTPLSSNTTKSNRRLDFQGSSSHSVRINIKEPQEGTHQKNSFTTWLKSKHSHPSILGSKQVSQTPDGMYKSILPSISWFGLELVPTFFQKIIVEENENDDSLAVNVSIEDSQVNIAGRRGSDENDSSISSKRGLIEKVMASCVFTGSGNKMRCFRRVENGIHYYELSSSLTLNLEVPLTSRFIILPPGFNIIGSRIVKRETEKRVKENLLLLVKEYHSFARNDLN
jgi:hypothetical protein